MEKTVPTFLKVICIFTIVYSSWGIYSGISGYVFADRVVEVSERIDELLEETMDDLDDELQGVELPIMTRMNEARDQILTPFFTRKNSIGKLIGSLLTLFAAVLMLRLNRNGFFLYLFGKAILFVAPLVFLNGLAMFYGIGLDVIILLIFVPMYSVNYKHLQ